MSKNETALPTLKSVFAGDFDIGCSAPGKLPDCLSAAERQLMLSQFSCFTPENHMKAAHVQPVEGQFDFEIADSQVAFAQAQGMKIFGHCLVWYQSSPAWFFTDGNQPVSADKLLQRLRQHIHTLVGRYRGRISGWDVVNEAIDDASGYLRDCPWLQILGEDFIAHAFRFAHEADPHVELYYNDYAIEPPEKRGKTLRLLRWLQKQGVRLDGVGIQGHWQMQGFLPPLGEIEEAIVAYHELGLKVMITELDLDALPRQTPGADTSKSEIAGEPEQAWTPQRQAQQAELYAQLFKLFGRHRDKITRVSFWCLHDGRSWLNNWPVRGRTNHPLLFDRACRPKPAFFSVTRL